MKNYSSFQHLSLYLKKSMLYDGLYVRIMRILFLKNL